MGTIRSGVFTKKLVKKPKCEIIEESFNCETVIPRSRIVQSFAEESDRLDLEAADIIVAAGRGLGSAKGFSLIHDFAHSIGAEVAASRAAVEAGWIPHVHQVGQTGKTVSPRVYIACGISGAAQHLAGMSNAATIIAINKNPHAAIFDVADYGIVGDLFEVLPQLQRELITLLKLSNE
jgi:electron transfer flavoprotein alpha subunit